MGTPYEYTRVTIRRHFEGRLLVDVALMRADGSHKYPRAVQPPWRHTYSLPSDFTVEALFWELQRALRSLGASRAEPPAPPEGATGGPLLEQPDM